MNPDLRESTFRYYDERAPEYDEIYTLGKGSTSISDPSAYIGEVGILSGLVARFCQGRLLDLPCGTGFWLPHYAARCVSTTMLDQSPGGAWYLAELVRLACADKAEDFEVLEDGVPQDLGYFTAESTPVTVLLLLDKSSSIHKSIDGIKSAAMQFLQRLRPGDEAAVAFFNHDLSSNGN